MEIIQFIIRSTLIKHTSVIRLKELYKKKGKLCILYKLVSIKELKNEWTFLLCMFYHWFTDSPLHQAYSLAITHICTPEEIDMLHKQTVVEHDERLMDQTSCIWKLLDLPNLILICFMSRLFSHTDILTLFP